MLGFEGLIIDLEYRIVLVSFKERGYGFREKLRKEVYLGFREYSIKVDIVLIFILI